MINNEDRAYIAGLFDGEGHVGFTQSGQSKTWALRVMITNTNKSVLTWVQSLYGGKIYSFHGKRHWKVGYHFVLLWDVAAEFLSDIEPWLRIKQEQAWVGIAWNEVRHRGSGPRSASENECMDLLVRQLRWLNKKGIEGQQGSDPVTVCLQQSFGTLFPDEYIEEHFEFVEEDHASY